MFWFFGHKACGILPPPPGIESASPALKGKVLTTEPPGKSQYPPLLVVWRRVVFTQKRE